MVQHLTVAWIAEALAVSWTRPNDAVVLEGQRAPSGSWLGRSHLPANVPRPDSLLSGADDKFETRPQDTDAPVEARWVLCGATSKPRR